MPNLKKIKINNSNIFDIFNTDNLLAGTNIGIVEYDDGSVDLSTLTYGVEYILGTQSSATNVWLGTSADLGCNNGTLYNGKVIIYHLPYNGNTSPVTLNLTLADGSITGDINVKYLSGTNVTNEFSAGYDIFMIYDGTLWKTSASGTSKRTLGIPYAEVDSTSTATAYTATIPGITELVDGTCMLLKNGRVTSASGFTININGLGAKPCYSNMATGNDVTPTNPTRDTTIFNINYTMLFVYSTDIVSGGGWICYRGYDENTNTIGNDIIEHYNGSKKVKTACLRYQLLLSTVDDFLLPIYSGTYTTGTSKTLTTEAFNPFGLVYYYNSTTNLSANGTLANDTLKLQSTNGLVDLRYSFNTGSTLKAGDDIYLVCVPQADGTAKLHTAPIAKSLPSTEDGLIYKRLGRAYDTYRIILEQEKPCYYYKDGALREWVNALPTNLPLNYTPSSLSNEELLLEAGDHYNTAFGKLEKAILDDEKVVSKALTDINTETESIKLNITLINQDLSNKSNIIEIIDLT